MNEHTHSEPTDAVPFITAECSSSFHWLCANLGCDCDCHTPEARARREAMYARLRDTAGG